MGESISPKSIVSSGTGIFAAQNMMYRHTVTLYDKNGNLLAKIPDKINLAAFGYHQYSGEHYLGGPVEAVFSNQGNYLWVSNYNMIGDGFNNPGCDGCSGSQYDPGFVYKINTTNYKIENVIQVGAVPKYLAIDKEEKIMLSANWSSADISVVDLTTEKEIKRINVGAHPRGIAISSDSKIAYVAVMGSTKIAAVNLENDEVTYIENMGKSPRHLVLTKNDSLLYVAANSSNAIIKYNLHKKTKQICTTNAGPRSMILSPDEKNIYVVNYFANTFSKINADSMVVCEVVETGHHPIGITANWDESEIWVACYEGKIEIFKDFQLAKSKQGETYIFENELQAFLNLFGYEYASSNYTVAVNEHTTKENAVITTEETATTNSTHVKTSAPPKQDTVQQNVIVVNQKVKTKKPDVVNFNNTNSSPIATEGNCTYHIIVGSFSIADNATNFVTTVKAKGYPAQTIPTSKGLTYVSAQCFNSREEANNQLAKINADLAVHGWVLKR